MYFRYRLLDALIACAGNKTHDKFPLDQMKAAFPHTPTDELLSTLHLLMEEGFVVYGHINKSAVFRFSVLRHSRAFLVALKEQEQKERHEKWKERLYGFIAGVLTTSIGHAIAKTIAGQ